MRVSVTFRHMEASDAVRDYIEEKIESLKKFLLKPIDVHVTLSVEKFRHTAEIILVEGQFQAKAKEESDDMYASLDSALDKIGKQVKKHKEKMQEHHKHHLSVGETAAIEEEHFSRNES